MFGSYARSPLWTLITVTIFVYISGFQPFLAQGPPFLKIYPMNQFSMLTSHKQLVKNNTLKIVLNNLLHSKDQHFQERFIKEFRNTLRTTRNFRWTVGGPRGTRLESLVYIDRFVCH